MNQEKTLISLKQITREFQVGENRVQALKGIDLKIKRGEFIALMGPSGSGKSTLLHILGCLDRPSSGEYFFKEQAITNFSLKKLAKLRSTEMSFVFQSFNLIPQFNVIDNVELPFLYSEIDDTIARKKSLNAIEKVGLTTRLKHKPTELSGGEQQRVAIARALAVDAFLILADEPTGNLDSVTGESILALLKECHQEGKTIVIVTHDQQVAQYAQKIVYLKDGKLDRSLT